MKSNKSRFAILGLLSHAPGSGYDLRKLIDQTISHFWSESFGQIYPILRRLTEERLTRRKVERQNGRPDRQVYSISEKGRSELQEWLRRPAEYQVVRNETVLKLFFGNSTDPEVSIEHVERYRDHHLQMLGELTEIERVVMEDDPANPDLPFWTMTLEHGKVRSRATIRWCDDTLRRLRQMKNERGSGSRSAPTESRRG